MFVGFPTLSSFEFNNNSPFGTHDSPNYLRARIDKNGISPNNRAWTNSLTNRLDNYDVNKVDNSIHFYNRTSINNVNQKNTDLVNSITHSSLATTKTSDAILTERILLLRFNTNYFEQTAKMGIFALGSSLTTTEMEAVETAWYTNYFTSL